MKNKLLLGAGAFFLLVVMLFAMRSKHHIAIPYSSNAASSSEVETAALLRRVGEWQGGAQRPKTPRSNIKGALQGGVIIAPQSALQAFTGFVVDDFRGWTAIPERYFADGIGPAPGGGVTLADETLSGSRVGILLSPPLRLWQPSLAAPADNPTLPEGSGLRGEISLSSDGQTWTAWSVMEQRVMPDGNQAAPPPEPNWSGDVSDYQTSETQAADSASSGPLVRYRLTLTAREAESPVIKDLRIWRRRSL